MGIREHVFVQPWPFWVAGLGIGLFVVAFAGVTGNKLGVSSGFGTICAYATRIPHFRESFRTSWRLWFLLGVPLGAALATWLSGDRPEPWAIATFDASVSANPMVKALVFTIGGAMIGWGARRSGGCTSGHAIVGCALGARSSLLATAGFMIGGFATTWLFVLLTGGTA